MKYTKGKHTLNLDEEIIESLSNKNTKLRIKNDNFYFYFIDENKMMKVSQYVLKYYNCYNKAYMVDFKDNNNANLCLENIKLKPWKNSHYFNVHKLNDKYFAIIYKNEKKIVVGNYNKEIEAAVAVDKAYEFYNIPRLFSNKDLILSRTYNVIYKFIEFDKSFGKVSKTQGRKYISNTSSKYVGVYFCSQSGKWITNVCYLGAVRKLASFENERQAAALYDIAAKIIYGKNARTNNIKISEKNINNVFNFIISKLKHYDKNFKSHIKINQIV